MYYFFWNSLIIASINRFLNKSLNCFVKFTVNKVTIGTCNLVSVILNFAEYPALKKDSLQSNLIQNELYN